MADSFNVAPGVYYTERDATLATKSNLSAAAGFVGRFQWGPVEEIVNITSGESEAVDIFYKPSRGASGSDQLVLHDYFNYSKVAYVVRAFQVGMNNASATGASNFLVKNQSEVDSYIGSELVFAKYAGSLGNNIKVLTIDEAKRAEMKAMFDAGFRSGDVQYWSSLSYKASLSASERHVLVLDSSGAISGTVPTTFISRKEIEMVPDNTSVINTSATFGESSFPITVTWDGVATPTQTEWNAFVAAAFKDISQSQKTRNNIRGVYHNTVDDTLVFEFVNSTPADGSWYTVPADNFTSTTEAVVAVTNSGTLIEAPYERVSTTLGSVNPDTGLVNDWTKTINVNSRFVAIGPNWVGASGVQTLSGGSDGSDTNVDWYSAYDLLKASPKRFLGIIDPCADLGSQQSAIDIAVQRRSSVAFVAPLPEFLTKTSTTAKYNHLQEWRQNLLRDNSYMFICDNYAEVYDKYNKINRMIPVSGGTCGVWFRSISTSGTGKSPAFLNRGKYLSYRKLFWSAGDEQVAVLYNDYQVNSIREMDEGIILWGDRTGLSKESAFNRLNTRGVFIDCELSIATTAKYSLGENNDVFSRKLFDNAVTPFLRAKVERNEIEDFYLKTDETNNNAQVVVSNQFVSGVYIKPKYSINFVFLDFVAVRPDVQFSEVENVG